MFSFTCCLTLLILIINIFSDIINVNHGNKPATIYPASSQPVHPPFKQQSAPHLGHPRTGGIQSRIGPGHNSLARDGVFAASGYRPASHYGTTGPRQPPPHHSNMSAPRSKV